MPEQAIFSDIEKLIGDFCALAQDDLTDRLALWKTDFAQAEVHEVVGGLLARQISLASEFARCPHAWSEHLAPIVMRAMADVHITLVWLLKDPSQRCKKYIIFGLGQEKLQLEHRKLEMATRTLSEGEREALDAMERHINAQRAMFLTDVNLGSWSGISSRAMAEEADCLDFYNFVYTPFSAAVHSTWPHVSKFNLKRCGNPLHQYHSVPEAAERPIDPHYLYLAGKYLAKTLASFDEIYNVKVARPSAFDCLCKALDELADKLEKESQE